MFLADIKITTDDMGTRYLLIQIGAIRIRFQLLREHLDRLMQGLFASQGKPTLMVWHINYFECPPLPTTQQDLLQLTLEILNARHVQGDNN